MNLNRKHKTEKKNRKGIKEKEFTWSGSPAPQPSMQPSNQAPQQPSSSPTEAQQSQPSPTHLTVRIKKKKNIFFFFPENDTAEERPGHVSGDDKLDPDVAKPSKTSPHRIRVHAHPKRAKIHAPIPCQRRRVSEPTTTDVPSFPTIPRSIKPPGGPP
jgi:hypothetical protein